MPPQIRTPDPSTPVNSQAPVTIEQPKSTEVDKKAVQKQEPPKQDPETAAKNAEAAKQHAAGKRQQNVADEQRVRNNLDQRVPDKKTDKAPTTAKAERHKPTANQSDKGAWGFVKDAARFASDAAGVGVEILRDRTAEASAEATKTAQASAIAERDRKVRDMKLGKKGEEIRVELQRVGSGKPSFEESERLIQKIDAYKRELNDNESLNSLYAQETVKPTRMATRGSGPFKYEEKSEFQDAPVNHMKNLLGAYGYDTKLGGSNPSDREGNISQHQILETALHNWRATPVEQRRTLHSFDGPPAKLPNGWKTPHDMREANKKAVDEQITAKEVYGKLHYDSPQKHQPNPNDRMADLQHETTQTAWTVISSGPSHATPRPNLGSTPTISPNRTASPPEPVSVAETQPGPTKAYVSRNQGGPKTGTIDIENARAQQNSGQAAKTSSSKAMDEPVKDKIPHAENVKPSESKMPNVMRAQAPTDRPRSSDEAAAREETRLQQRRVENALENLDKDTLGILTDRLRDEGTLTSDGSKEAKARRGWPGDARPYLEEVREALVRSRDPKVTEVLETNDAGLVVQGEVNALHAARDRVKLLRKDPPPMGKAPW